MRFMLSGAQRLNGCCSDRPERIISGTLQQGRCGRGTIGSKMAARRITTALTSGLLLFGLAGCETHKGGKSKSTKGEPKVAASSTQQQPGRALSNSKARIEFAEREHDLGTIPDSQPASHTFKFKNSGSETLVIEKVGSS